MTDRLLVPQLITTYQLTLSRLTSIQDNLTITSFPTGVSDLEIILFDMSKDDLFNVYSPNNYICTDDILQERGLTTTEAYAQAMKNLEAMPCTLLSVPSRIAHSVSTFSVSDSRTDSFASMRCFSKTIMDSLIDTSVKRYIAFPNLNVPFIFENVLSFEMVKEATKVLFDEDDVLNLSSKVYVIENGIVSDI